MPVNKPYQKVVLKRKDPQNPPPPPKKKIKPMAPAYPDVVFEKPVRLNRFIANTGLCSRREADEHIKNGFIKVNGELVTEMGKKVNPDDEVCFKDKALSNQRKIYLLLNKPKGFVTSVDEPNGKKIVMDLVRSACKERIYPVGRLDKMTTGVLLFTNDGDLSLKLTHPSNRMRKVYQASLDKPLTDEDLEKLAQGIDLEDGPIACDSIAHTDPEDKKQIGVEIHSGKNRIVRRMFESVGYKVLKLDRVYFAGLTRKGLKRGKWRFLSPEEVAFLKMMPSVGVES
jgi:23S rRNA pseudouridine2605 synthase